MQGLKVDCKDDMAHGGKYFVSLTESSLTLRFRITGFCEKI